jgi:hypothetical protein
MDRLTTSGHHLQVIALQGYKDGDFGYSSAADYCIVFMFELDL